jgi:aspartate/methionine/tyrosine aminotransferase
MPGRGGNADRSLREAERELEHTATEHPILDLTYADTHRFPAPDWVLEEFERAAGGEGMTYTPYRGDSGVREAVANNVSAAFSLDTDPDRNIILTPGTQAALFTAFASLIEPGDTVILADPEYLSTERMLWFYGANVIHLPLVSDGQGLAELDMEAFEAALVHEPRLLIFSNPNNPTGVVHTRESIEAIAEIAIRADMAVLVDQLYCRLLYDGADYTHLAHVDGMAERTVTLLGPSKTESMSGYRLGLALASGCIIDRMEDVLSVSALRAPAYAQHLLKRWLADDQEYVKTRIAEYESLRDTTIDRIGKSQILEVEPAKGTAYLFPRVVPAVGVDVHTIATTLKRETGIVVNPGYQFGPAGEGHFRVCFAQDEKVWDSALDRMIAVVESLHT